MNLINYEGRYSDCRLSSANADVKFETKNHSKWQSNVEDPIFNEKKIVNLFTDR